RLRPLELNRLVEVGERLLDGVPSALDAVVRIEYVHDSAPWVLVRPAPWVAGRLHGAAGRAVIRAVAGEDLVASGDSASDLDRVLVCVGAGQSEEDLVDVARQQLGELGAEARPRLVGHERADVGQVLGLALYRVDDPPVAVTRVDAHELAVEVDEAAPVRCVEVHALRAGHRKGFQAGLCRPVIQRVAQTEFGDLFRAEGLDGLHDHLRIVLGQIPTRRLRSPRAEHSQPVHARGVARAGGHVPRPGAYGS